MRRVLRRALPEDWQRRERGERRQAEAYLVCKEKIAALHVPMKLIEAEWAFEGAQVTFHFTAEGRVDFRELVREVAAVLHTRVQMHQVGARDHARIFPGIGPCGRPTCCSTFLREFQPVSMKMVKNQNLVLNPAKFSGLCGKLMCCLRYEQEGDEPGRPALPQAGMVVMTPMGRAKVEEVNALQQMVTVQLESQQFVEVRAKDIGEVPDCVDHTRRRLHGLCRQRRSQQLRGSDARQTNHRPVITRILTRFHANCASIFAKIGYSKHQQRRNLKTTDPRTKDTAP